MLNLILLGIVILVTCPIWIPIMLVTIAIRFGRRMADTLYYGK